MGWWSRTVLGGDEPLDWHGNLAHVMGLSYERDQDGAGYNGYPYTRELVEEHMDAMMNKIGREPADGLIKTIGWQVLGAIALKVGATIPDGLKVAVVQATKDDSWAKRGDDPERIRWMEDLAEKITNTKPGVRVDLTTESLLVKVLESIVEDRA